MKALLDTSTLIAAMLPDHVHHSSAHRWLSQAKAKAFEYVVSSHSMAEIYAVLTRLPRSPRIEPDEAVRLIRENVTSCATLISLSGDDYLALIESLASAKIAGGAVYGGVAGVSGTPETPVNQRRCDLLSFDGLDMTPLPAG